MASIYTHRNFYTETLLHTEAFTHSKLLNTKSFTHSKLLQKKVFTQRKFLAGIEAPKLDLGAKAKKRRF